MKKLFLFALISLCACNHKAPAAKITPIEKAKPVIMRYMDSIGKNGAIRNVVDFKEEGKYSFSCGFAIKESKTSPYFLGSTAFFKLDSNLSKVINFHYITE